MRYFLIHIGVSLFIAMSLGADEGEFVTVNTYLPDCHVRLAYTTTDNFVGRDMYGDLDTCHLTAVAARKLKKARKLLAKARPELTFLIYDCLRPRRVQKMMWDAVKGTDKQKYVANPRTGSIHNYGAAVDVTLATRDGKPLDMGTPFDYLGKRAQPRYEKHFLHTGVLTKKQVANRRLLRHVMREAGFQAIASEWWHFNAVPIGVLRKEYRIIETLDDIRQNTPKTSEHSSM